MTKFALDSGHLFAEARDPVFNCAESSFNAQEIIFRGHVFDFEIKTLLHTVQFRHMPPSYTTSVSEQFALQQVLVHESL
ncbi:hypothetical protein XI05_09210 [Bradyrhizobium sp. CCBAU 11357]|nr:hypothetical protein [Bradyrhizobium sp. CCBAU 11357]